MNRVAIITGGAGGIGLATAETFARAGWICIGLDKNTPDKVPEGVEFKQVDLADPVAVRGFFEMFGRDHDRLDALVNNAAIQICKPLVEMSVEEWDAVQDVNLRAAFLTVKWGYPYLKRASGAVVNVSSVHALATSKDVAGYAASKGGLVALTRAMALEFAQDGVRANAVLPGAVDTGMLREGLSRGHVSGGSIDDRLAELAAKTVMGRVGQPGEIGRAILFLATSEESGFMTGQILTIDGGATARLSTE